MDKSSNCSQISPEPAQIGISQSHKIGKKESEEKYLFKFDFRESISSMGHTKILLKTIISIVENWLN